jgi:hypothetical protein
MFGFLKRPSQPRFWVVLAFLFLVVEHTSAANTNPVRHFAVIGDFGDKGESEQAVSTIVHDAQPDFIVTTGDNNYPNGAKNTLDDNIGAYYHDYILFPAEANTLYRKGSAPFQRFFPALGNHDWRTRIHGQPAMHNYFALPGNRRYYIIKEGPVALFFIDSDKHEPDGVDVESKQAKWLKKSLAEVDLPWKIVVFHHPPYSRGAHGSSTYMRWPYAKWGASLVLSGHDHHYERSIVDGLNYIVVGTGGAELRDANRDPDPDLQFNTVCTHAYGALMFRATPKWLVGTFYDIHKNPKDSFSIKPLSP